MRLVVAALMTSQILSAAPYLMYVGTYTKKDSKGIYAYRFDAQKGTATALGLVAETPSPSWLTLNAEKHVIYAANELGDYQGLKSGAVSAWEMNRSTGKLKQLSIAPTRGADPCHVVMESQGKFVYAANYTGGSVVRYPVKLDGSLGESDKFIQHQAVGSAQPHAHQVTVSPDGKTLLVADLGLDQVITYDLDLNHAGEVTGQQGAGPRHLAIHPSHKYAYVLNELASSVTTYAYDGRALTPKGDTLFSTQRVYRQRHFRRNCRAPFGQIPLCFKPRGGHDCHFPNRERRRFERTGANVVRRQESAQFCDRSYRKVAAGSESGYGQYRGLQDRRQIGEAHRNRYGVEDQHASVTTLHSITLPIFSCNSSARSFTAVVLAHFVHFVIDAILANAQMLAD